MITFREISPAGRDSRSQRPGSSSRVGAKKKPSTPGAGSRRSRRSSPASPAGTQTRLAIVPPREQNSATKPAACVQLKTSSSSRRRARRCASRASGTRTCRARPSSRAPSVWKLKKFGAGSSVSWADASAVDERDPRPPSREVLQREALVASERADQDVDADLVDEPSCLRERRGGRRVGAAEDEPDRVARRRDARRRRRSDRARRACRRARAARARSPASVASREVRIAALAVGEHADRRSFPSRVAHGVADGVRRHPDRRRRPRRCRPGSPPTGDRGHDRDSSSGRSGRRFRRSSSRPRPTRAPTATPRAPRPTRTVPTIRFGRDRCGRPCRRAATSPTRRPGRRRGPRNERQRDRRDDACVVRVEAPDRASERIARDPDGPSPNANPSNDS